MDIHTADNRVYEAKPEWPLWKRLLFRFVFAPFVVIGYEKFKFVPWDHQDKDGNYSWLERQGLFADKWMAEQEAAKYPHGFSITMRLNEAQPAETIHGVQTNGKPYNQRINSRTVEFPTANVLRLRQKLTETDELVNHFRQAV